MTRTLLLDVDTQVDFMAPDGALSVPNAQILEPRLARLVAAARAAGVPHVATMDAHAPDDPEFAAYGFPAHCVAGTAGQAKVAATRQLAPVEVQGGDAITPAVLAARELVFPKVTFDVFDNPAFARYLAAFAPDRVVVCGVATDYCVKAAVLGLLQRGLPVLLVTDAIAPVTEETGRAALELLIAKGARPVDTLGAVAALEVRHVARA